MSGFRFPVEAAHILMFARAIGDENPVHTDPRSAEAAEFGGVLAPPTFTMAAAHFDPEYPLRPRPGEPWFGSAAEPSGAVPDDPGWLHAEQHFEYRRPVIAGEVLEVVERPGRTWEKASRGGGTLRFEEHVVEYCTAWSDEPAVVARFVRVLPVPAGGSA